MTGVRHETVLAADDGLRLDRWFRQHFPDIRHGQLQKMLRKGEVRVDGGRVQADRRIQTGERIRIPPLPDAAPAPERRQSAVSPKDAAFIRELVLYEDADVIALNKPFGIAVQGGEKQTRHIDGMLPALAGRGETPRLVHRLDRDTGGVLVLGRSRKSAAALAEAFKRHEVTKDYWALTRGVPHPREGRISAAVRKQGSEGREQMAVSRDGKAAITDYQVVEAAGRKAAFVAVRPETGRTHQIRVHLATIGTPIVGDRKYGGTEAMVEGIAPRMHLFCRSMRLPHPSGKWLDLEAPLTGHMAATWSLFGFEMHPLLEWPE
jgi:23S rRNA pseudouridine955/2504/2580 synthase